MEALEQLASLTADQRRLVEHWLRRQQEQAVEASQPSRIPRRGEKDACPLSFTQQRLWFLDRWEPGSAAYNFRIAVRLIGGLDLATLERSLNEIVRRHEILRTTFAEVEGRPIQVIAPSLTIGLPLIDLGGLCVSEAEAEARLHQLALEEAGRPFDLDHGPLLRAYVLRLNAEEHVLLLVIHHIVFDGWSQGILLRELAILYLAFLKGKPSPLPELPIQYADYAVWQRNWLQGAVLEAQLAYWCQQLAGLPPLELPSDRPRPPTISYRGATLAMQLPAALSGPLHTLCQQEGVTLFMLLLAAFGVVLHRYSGQSDLALGTPHAGRTRAELEELIGFFANTLVLRLDMAGRPSVRALLGRVREVCLSAYEHQDAPFEKLVDALRVERSLSRAPLFQVLFALQSMPLGEIGVPGLRWQVLSMEQELARFDLALSFRETPAGLTGVLNYSTDLFSAQRMERLVAHLQVVLAAMVANPERRISELPLLTAAERSQIVEGWSAGQKGAPSEACFHRLFEAQAARTPDAIAVVFDRPPTTNDRPPTTDHRQGDKETRRGRSQNSTLNTQHSKLLLHTHCLTYRELNERANRLAHHLRGLGVGPGVRVGICLERSLALAVTVLGVLKAGGAYVPLDPNYPAERLGYMLEDSQARVLITTNDHRPTTTDQRQGDRETGRQGDRETETTQLSILYPLSSVIDLVADWPAIAQQPVENPDSSVVVENAAYVIYTSGSTGRPKGVVVTHRGLGNLAAAQGAAFGVGAGSRVLQFAALSFDASVSELAMAWLNGATLCLGQLERLQPGPELVEWLDEQAITTVTFPPSALGVLPEGGWPGLASLVVAGEACPAELVARWAAAGRLFNAYGPTEATVCATLAECGGESDKPPIGRPIANMQVYVLDQALQPVPVGVPGELYIGGVGLARGYLSRPDLTAERFVPNPFADCRLQIADCRLGDDTPAIYNLQSTIYNSSRLYKTGDLVCWRPDGNLEFLGRIDEQVKVRGFRIEPGEIESLLGRHPALHQAVVIAREDAPGVKRLVAYLVPTNDQRPTTNGERPTTDHRPSTTDRRQGDKETRGQGDEETATQHSTLNTQNFSEQSTIYNLQSAIPERLSSILYPLSSDLRAFLREKLPDYMIPSAFVFLDALPLTPSGKVDRRGLPAPDGARPQLAEAFVAPQTPVEETLAAIWISVLGIGSVGVHDNFFELGGDSILSIQIVARARAAGLQLLPKHMFQYQTIAALATAVDVAPVVQADQGVVTGLVPLTPIQEWFFAQNVLAPDHWNQAVLLEVRQTLDISLLQQAVRHLLIQHDALRMRFRQTRAGWEAINAGLDAAVACVESIDLSSLTAAEQAAVIETRATALQANLDLAEGLLVRVALFERGPERRPLLLIAIHHLVVDGVSWRILLEDIQTTYQQLGAGRAVRLPAKTLSFQSWARRLKAYAQTTEAAQELSYWLTQPWDQVESLPVDGRGANTIGSMRSVMVSLSAADTRALLQEVPEAYHTQVNDVLLAALAQAFVRWTGRRVLLIDLEGHGREPIFEAVDVSRTVGWFTSLFPVLLDVRKAEEPGEVLKSVKEQLRRIPQRGLGYGLLRYGREDAAVAEQLGQLPQAEVSFNYLGQLDQVLSDSALFAGPHRGGGSSRSVRSSRSHLLEINGGVTMGQLQLTWSYSQAVHLRATVERLAEMFLEALQAMIRHCRSGGGGYTPSDFPDVELSQDDLDDILTKLGEA